MTNQTQTVRLIELHNRFMDLHMKGSWGYVDPELKARGFAMITAESYIEELEVIDTRVFDENMKELPSPLVIGIDKYGRNLEIPVDRIIAIKFLDTKEQARLKAVTKLKSAYANISHEILKDDDMLREMISENRNLYDELLAKGVKLYQRGE